MHRWKRAPSGKQVRRTRETDPLSRRGRDVACTSSCWTLVRLAQGQVEYLPVIRWAWGWVVESRVDAEKLD